MATRLRYKKVPFDNIGKSMFSFLLAELICIWVVAIFSLFLLPTVIPLHFSFNGTPTSSGLNSTLMVIALLFSVAPAIILVAALFRYELLNKYPYLLVVPAFYAGIKSVASSRKGYWINQYFKILLVAGSYLSCILLVIILEIYTAAQKSYINGYLAVVIPMISIVVVAVLLILLLKDMYKRMAVESKAKKRRR